VPPEALSVITGIADTERAELIDAWTGVLADVVQPETFGPTRIRLCTPMRDYGVVALALPGAHQVENAIVAVRVLEALHSGGIEIPAPAVVEGLARVRWPGRLDLRILADGREVLLDAAHNPDGAAALARFLAASRSERRPILFAAMQDKDAAGMLRQLGPAASAFVLTRASRARSSDPSVLADVARAAAPDTRVLVESVLADALAAAWRLSPTIVVAGSIFLLGDVMEQIDGS
jgi:dihydrofolate synthase/folylpolyglutamate synthase